MIRLWFLAPTDSHGLQIRKDIFNASEDSTRPPAPIPLPPALAPTNGSMKAVVRILASSLHSFDADYLNLGR